LNKIQGEDTRQILFTLQELATGLLVNPGREFRHLQAGIGRILQILLTHLKLPDESSGLQKVILDSRHMPTNQEDIHIRIFGLHSKTLFAKIMLPRKTKLSFNSF
jgi:hypothetical protein